MASRFIGDGNGGGNFFGPTIIASPSSLNFGNVSTSGSSSLVLKIICSGNSGGTATLNNITVTGAGYTLSGLPSFPHVMHEGDTVSINVILTPTSTTTFTGTVSVTSTKGTPSVPLTGVGVAVNVSIVPAQLDFGQQVINFAASFLSVTITNNTGSSMQLLTGTFTNADYAFHSTSPAFPITIANGGNAVLKVIITPSVTGPDNGTLTITTTIGGYTITIALSAVGILFVESIPLTNSLRNFVLGFGPITGGSPSNAQAYQVDPTDFNSELAQTLIFNNTIWDEPGQEKALRRVEVGYENVGVCTLTLSVTSIRYDQVGNRVVDSQSSTITIGNSAADGQDYTQFADLQISGELLMLSVARAASAGNCSLTWFTPQFEGKGVKVGNV